MQDDRRGGGGRSGGRPGGARRDFGPRRDFGDRDTRGARREFPRERPYPSGDRPQGGQRPYPGGEHRDRGTPRPMPSRPTPRSAMDEGGMAIRLDPRRLSLLKQLSGESGLRPGELVTQWVEERLDAERTGSQAPATGSASAGGSGSASPALAALTRRVDDLARRVEQLTATSLAAPTGTAAADDRPGSAGNDNGRRRRTETATAGTQIRGATTGRAAASKRATATGARRATRAKAPAPTETAAAPTATAAKATARPSRPSGAGKRVPLHDEIARIVSEAGPMTAAQIAQAIVDGGRYTAPRSARPLDAAIVNSRVSNPIYRSRFRRQDGKIGLAEG